MVCMGLAPLLPNRSFPWNMSSPSRRMIHSTHLDPNFRLPTSKQPLSTGQHHRTRLTSRRNDNYMSMISQLDGTLPSQHSAHSSHHCPMPPCQHSLPMIGFRSNTSKAARNPSAPLKLVNLVSSACHPSQLLLTCSILMMVTDIYWNTFWRTSFVFFSQSWRQDNTVSCNRISYPRYRPTSLTCTAV
ncbi:hypothetical protein EMPG_14310 [Blastomyces silverae]|uniref:Uncharacterized protein n=1 Tax=Blastomyces silverae TaxID=2060906 RepID=A0A0H1BGV3_9EURO|nr:hypothetical protein EMPG_14310 [Blastomyces silverae]